jgi:uncharacterized integral membrane protein
VLVVVLLVVLLGGRRRTGGGSRALGGMSDPSATSGPSGPTDPVAPDPATSSATTTGPGRPAKDPLRGSRTGGVYVALGVAALVLVLLVVFIVQNTQSVRVSYLGWEGSAPLAAALLIAAVAGMVLALVTGSLRLLQVRRRVRRDRR